MIHLIFTFCVHDYKQGRQHIQGCSESDHSYFLLGHDHKSQHCLYIRSSFFNLINFLSAWLQLGHETIYTKSCAVEFRHAKKIKEINIC